MLSSVKRLLIPLLVALLLSGCSDVLGVNTKQPIRCDSKRPFGPFVPIAELQNLRTDFNPRLTADELTLYFLSDRVGVENRLQIWTASRASRDARWENIHVVKELEDSAVQFSGVAVTADGNTLYYSRPKDTGRALYGARRPARGEPFSGQRELFDHPDWYEFDLALSPSNEIIIAMGSRVGLAYELWSLRPPVVDDVNDPKRVFPNTIASLVSAPTISPDELELYFSTGTEEATQLYVARRATKDEPFGTPVAVSELDEPGRGEQAGWISPDNCRLYGATFRKQTGGAGTNGSMYWDLAVATRR